MANSSGTRRGFGSIRKLPSGRFQARYTGPDLQTHKAPHTFHTRDDAAGWLRAEEKLIAFDEWRSPTDREKAAAGATVASTTPVDKYVTSWIEGRALRPSSAATYSSLAKTRVEGLLTDTLTATTPATIRGWVARMQREHPDTPARNAQAYRLVATAMKTAVEDQLIEANPCQVPRAGAKPKAKTERLAEPDEFRALVAALPEVYRTMALVTAGCALRLGEVSELRRKDLDRRPDGTLALNVRRNVGFVGGVATVGRLKNGDGNRRVTVPPHLTDALNTHIAKFSQPGSEGLLFPNAAGTQIKPSGFRGVFKIAATKAGRPDLHPHSLRHLGAVQYAQAGATIRELMDRLGHSTPDTAIIYQHTATGRDAELAAKMSKMATE